MHCVHTFERPPHLVSCCHHTTCREYRLQSERRRWTEVVNKHDVSGRTTGRFWSLNCRLIGRLFVQVTRKFRMDSAKAADIRCIYSNHVKSTLRCARLQQLNNAMLTLVNMSLTPVLLYRTHHDACLINYCWKTVIYVVMLKNWLSLLRALPYSSIFLAHRAFVPGSAEFQNTAPVLAGRSFRFSSISWRSKE